MKRLIIILLIGLVGISYGQTSEIKPKGIYKEIDVERHNKVIEILNGEDKELKRQMVDSVLARPNFYNPPVIYALSRELFLNDKKEEASFWFYVGQLRARVDANVCLDGEYGPDINKYAFQNLDTLEKTVGKVVEFVKLNKEDYDRRWINLHGMNAVQNKKVKMSEPEDKWQNIKEKTIEDYYGGFIKYVKSKKKDN